MPVQVRRALHFFPLLLPLLLASGQETVHLKNGFTLVADSHTEIEGRIVLRTSTGTVEFPAGDVASVETTLDAARQCACATTPQDVLDAAAVDQQLPPELVRSVAKAESDFR